MTNKIKLRGCKDSLIAFSFIVLFTMLFGFVASIVFFILKNDIVSILSGILIANFWYMSIRMVNNDMIDTWGRDWKRLPYFTDLFEWDNKCGDNK